MEYCLKEAGVTVEDIEQIVFCEKPFLKFDRLLETYLSYAPRTSDLCPSRTSVVKTKLHLPREIKKQRLGNGKATHSFHITSRMRQVPFFQVHLRKVLLTMDGVGEWDTTTLGIGERTRFA